MVHAARIVVHTSNTDANIPIAFTVHPVNDYRVYNQVLYSVIIDYSIYMLNEH